MKLIAILVYLSLQILLVFSRVENTKLKGEDYTKVQKQIQGITQKWPFPSKCKKGTDLVEPQKCLKNIRKLPENYHQVVFGLLLENYSRYQLLHPTNQTEYKGYNTFIEPVEPILEGSSGLFVADNGKHKNYQARGSMSWQIFWRNGKPLEKRLIVTYNIPYQGKCDAETRGNAFSVTIEDIKTNETTGIWIKQNTKMGSSDYDLKHSEEHISSKLYDDSQSSPLIVKFDQGDFYLTASINSGCTPLLKIQFFHDVNEYENSAKEHSDHLQPLGQPVMIPPQNGVSKRGAAEEFEIVGPRRRTKDVEGHVPLTNPLSLPAKFTIGVGVGLAGLILLVLILIAWTKAKKRSQKPPVSKYDLKVDPKPQALMDPESDVESAPPSRDASPMPDSCLSQSIPEHDIVECNAGPNGTPTKCFKRSPSLRRRISESYE